MKCHTWVVVCGAGDVVRTFVMPRLQMMIRIKEAPRFMGKDARCNLRVQHLPGVSLESLASCLLCPVLYAVHVESSLPS
jgi:hypothetical protein